MEYAYVNKRTLEIISIHDEANQILGVVNRAAVPRYKNGTVRTTGIKRVPVVASTATGNPGDHFEYRCSSQRFAVRRPIDRKRAETQREHQKAVRGVRRLMAKHGVTPADLKAELLD